MQNLIVLGNLGADAEVRVVNDKKFVSFKVADTQRFTDNKGVSNDKTTWISCAWSSDGGNLLPFLKKGVKILVIGRPSYKVYSSAKERMMMAGVDLHVISIELAGGTSDDVPRKLVNPSTGALIDVFKCYYVRGIKDCQLVGERGGLFNVDSNGFVTPVRQDSQLVNNVQAQLVQQQGENTSEKLVEIFGESSVEAQTISQTIAKNNDNNK